MKRTPTDQIDSLSIFCHKMYYKEDMTLQQIGELVAKDHSTIIHHLKRYSRKIKVSDNFRTKVNDFRIADFVENYAQKKIKIEDITVKTYYSFLIN